MEKPKEKDFVLKSFKIEKGVRFIVVFNFLFSKNGAAHNDDIKLTRTLIPHKDLVTQLWDLKEIVIQCEEIDYARKIFDINGVKSTKEMENAVDVCVNEASNKIKVTGFSLSGKNKKRNCVITYKKTTGNNMVAGRSTTAILLGANIYGFENDLVTMIESIESEVYKYLYGDKYNDVEQGQLYPAENQKEGDEKKAEKKESKKDTKAKK